MDTSDPQSVARAFVDAINRQDPAAAVGVLAEDVTVHFPGVRVFEGKDDYRQLLEFTFGLNTQMHLLGFPSVERGVLAYRAQHEDAWTMRAGIGPMQYSRLEFRIDGEGLIAGLTAQLATDSHKQLGKWLEAFLPWVINHHPELFAPDGDFIYTEESARDLVTALEEWLNDL